MRPAQIFISNHKQERQAYGLRDVVISLRLLYMDNLVVTEWLSLDFQ